MFYYCLNGRDIHRNIFQHFFHVHFMEKLNEICLRDNFFSLNTSNILYFETLVCKWSHGFQCHNLLTLKSSIPKSFRCCIVKFFIRFGLDPTRGSLHPLYPRCKGNLLNCLVASFDCP